MVTKKAGRASSKRGTVQRIPARTRARTANKTLVANFHKAELYADVEKVIYNKSGEFSSKIYKLQERIRKNEERRYQLIERCNRYEDLKNKWLEKNDAFKAFQYLKKIRDTSKLIRDCEASIKEDRELIPLYYEQMNAYKEIAKKVEPIRWNYAVHGRKASDRQYDAVGGRGYRIGDKWNDEHWVRK